MYIYIYMCVYIYVYVYVYMYMYIGSRLGVPQGFQEPSVLFVMYYKLRYGIEMGGVEFIRADIETWTDRTISGKSIKQCKTRCENNLFQYPYK